MAAGCAPAAPEARRADITYYPGMRPIDGLELPDGSVVRFILRGDVMEVWIAETDRRRVTAATRPRRDSSLSASAPSAAYSGLSSLWSSSMSVTAAAHPCARVQVAVVVAVAGRCDERRAPAGVEREPGDGEVVRRIAAGHVAEVDDRDQLRAAGDDVAGVKVAVDPHRRLRPRRCIERGIPQVAERGSARLRPRARAATRTGRRRHPRAGRAAHREPD